MTKHRLTAGERALAGLFPRADERNEGSLEVRLEPNTAASLEQRFLGAFSREASLDGIDYVAAGLAGALGAAIDLLLVGLPQDMNYAGDLQRGGVLTRLLKAWQVESDNPLAARARVPFDLVSGGPRVDGMFPGNHRLLTPGHDPLLGLLFGVIDIVRGGRTSIDVTGTPRHDSHLGEGTDILSAIVLEVLHLISDVATKAGLPAPLMTAANLLQFGSFGPKGRSVADLTRFMYAKGYDLRHFAASCSAPTAIRLSLAAYYLGRQYLDTEYEEAQLAASRRDGTFWKHPHLCAMTVLADAVACAANAGKIAIYSGNPCAFNLAQWMAFLNSASAFVATRLESPTEILIDRTHANDEVLRRRWKEIQAATGLDWTDASEAF